MKYSSISLKKKKTTKTLIEIQNISSFKYISIFYDVQINHFIHLAHLNFSQI